MSLAAVVVVAEFGSCRLGLDSMLSLAWLGFELMARADLNKKRKTKLCFFVFILMDKKFSFKYRLIKG